MFNATGNFLIVGDFGPLAMNFVLQQEFLPSKWDLGIPGEVWGLFQLRI